MEALERATAEDVVTVDTEEYGEVVLRAELEPTWSGLAWSPVINPPPPPSEETKKANAAIYMGTKRYEKKLSFIVLRRINFSYLL